LKFRSPVQKNKYKRSKFQNSILQFYLAYENMKQSQITGKSITAAAVQPLDEVQEERSQGAERQPHLHACSTIIPLNCICPRICKPAVS